MNAASGLWRLFSTTLGRSVVAWVCRVLLLALAKALGALVGLFVLLWALSFAVHAGEHRGKPVYLGDGRYTCQGSGCERFNAREREYQWERENERRRDRYNVEEREARERERDSYRSYRRDHDDPDY